PDRQHCDRQSEDQAERDVDDDPLDVVEERALRREVGDVEEVGVLEEILEVLQSDPTDETERKVAVVEREPDRVVGRVQNEQGENDERRQRKGDPLQPLLERALTRSAIAPLRLRYLDGRGLSAQRVETTAPALRRALSVRLRTPWPPSSGSRRGDC